MSDLYSCDVQNVIVFYSGGINSFFAAERAIEKYGKAKVSLVFTDTKKEDEDLYRFLVETANYLDIPLTWLAEGRDIWQVMNDERLLGNTKFDPCSKILKRKFARRWLERQYACMTTRLVFGIDWSESDRTIAMQQRWLPYACEFPLCERPFLPYERYFTLLKERNIPAPRLYAYGFTHNNCGGFCVKAGKKQFRKLLEHFPARYADHEDEEQRLIARIGREGKELGILRHVVKGVKHYITLKQFREMEAGPDEEEDVGACGCFAGSEPDSDPESTQT